MCYSNEFLPFNLKKQKKVYNSKCFVYYNHIYLKLYFYSSYKILLLIFYFIFILISINIAGKK